MSLGDDRGMLLLDLKIEMMLESCATDGCLVNYLVKWTPCYQFWKKVVRVKSFLNVRAKRCDGYISFLSFIEREGKVLHDDHWNYIYVASFFYGSIPASLMWTRGFDGGLCGVGWRWLVLECGLYCEISMTHS